MEIPENSDDIANYFYKKKNRREFLEDCRRLTLATIAMIGVGGMRNPINIRAENHKQKTIILQQNLMKEYLLEHADYVVKNILPSMEKEIPFILEQKTNGIKWSYGVDYADLFHTHLRYPEYLELKNGEEDLYNLQQLFDQKNFHLQYHSKEFTNLMEQRWIESLEKIPNEKVHKWTDNLKQEEKINKNYYGKIIRHNLLTNEEIEEFVDMWDEYLRNNYGQFLDKDELKNRIIILDGSRQSNYSRAGNILWLNRSIVSSEEGVFLMDRLDIDDFWQPLTIYFEDKDDCEGLLPIFEEAEKNKIHYIIALNNKYLKNISGKFTSTYVNKHNSLENRLHQAVKKISDPYNVFKNKSSDFDWDNFQVFAQSENYIFALYYFLEHRSWDEG